MADRAALTPSRRLTLALGLHQIPTWATTFYVPAVILDDATRDLRSTPAALLAGLSGALLGRTPVQTSRCANTMSALRSETLVTKTKDPK